MHKERGGNVKIATWNLESVRPLTKGRKTAFCNAMKGVKADVWVLTETWTDLEPLENYQLVAQSGKACDLKAERRWVSIWVHRDYSAEKLAVQSPKQQDRMAAAQITDKSGHGVVVVGTVLPWNSDRLWSGAKGYCDALAHQAIEWKRLRELSDTGTFVVAGDFNQALPYQRWYGSKKGAEALQDALRNENLHCLTQGDDPLRGEPRIDHICISRSGLHPAVLQEPNTWEVPCIGGRPITDHSGVFLDLNVI